MRIFLIFFLVLFHTISSPAQLLEPVEDKSKVRFTIKNFGIKTQGDFAGLQGQILFDTASLEKSSVDVTVRSETIRTGNKTRDRNLKNTYLQAEEFPLIQMTSTKIEKTNKTADGYYYFTGNLTIKGVTKEVAFPFLAQKDGQDYRFTGTFRINRLDFNVGSRSIVLADTVTLSIDIMAKPDHP